MIVIIFQCCSSSQKDIEKIVKEWQGKEIIVPHEIEFKIFGRDTLCSDLLGKSYKILTYVDSIGCTSCQLGLPHWLELIQISERQQMNVAFLFVVHSSNYHLFTLETIANEFNYPIIYDYNNSFYKLNHFPPDPYRTFLLDGDNKVQLIGSPIESFQIWELYKKAISQP